MAEIDRSAIEKRGIPAIELMENAGRAVAEETVRFLERDGSSRLRDMMITVCCGRGNNGGDGLVAARHLKRYGAEVQAFILPPKRDSNYNREVSANLKSANEAGVSVHEASEVTEELEVRTRSSHAVIDALLGTGASGKPAGLMRKMIQAINRSNKPVIAIDIPSGLHPDTGYRSGVVVEADLTCAIGLAKKGLLAAPAKKLVGELRVLDIGFPKDLLIP